MKKILHKVFVSKLPVYSKKKAPYLQRIQDIFDKIKETFADTSIELVAIDTADLWMRDFMPIQIDEQTFVTYEYRPDYLCNKEYRKYITRKFATPEKIRKNAGKDKELPFYKLT